MSEGKQTSSGQRNCGVFFLVFFGLLSFRNKSKKKKLFHQLSAAISDLRMWYKRNKTRAVIGKYTISIVELTLTTLHHVSFYSLRNHYADERYSSLSMSVKCSW